MQQFIKEALKESIQLKEEIFHKDLSVIVKMVQMAEDTLRHGGKILLCGNGGSAADSQHIAAEFIGRFQKERRSLPAIALTTDTSILTAIGNDYGHEHIFA